MPVVCGGFLYRFWAIYNRNSNVAEGGSAMEKIEGEYPKRVLAAFLAALLIGCGSQPVVRESVPATTAPMPTPAPAAKPAPEPQPIIVPIAVSLRDPKSVPEPKPAPVAETVILPRIALFDPNSSRLKPETKAKLDELVSRIAGTKIEKIRAIGYVDAGKGNSYNQRLSFLRADAVKEYLVGKGIEKNLVYTEGTGTQPPSANNRTHKDRAQNDRVDIEMVMTRLMQFGLADGWRPNDTIPVLFATNRQRTGSDNPYYFYGNRLSDEQDSKNLRRGIAVIKVPPNRNKGELKQPGWVHVTLERVTTHPLAHAIGIPEVQAADKLTEFSYAQKLEELNETDFGEALKSAVVKSQSKTAVLYVHGFANDFNDAAFRTAQIVYDLSTPGYDLVALMFSWPSDPGVILSDYDEARKRSEGSGFDLAQFLKEVAANTDIGTIHIIAHSMGAEVLGYAMLKLGVSEMGVAQVSKPVKPVFRQIVFAAPDVTPRIFQDVIEPAIRTNHLITTYGATTDLPLWLSAIKNRQPRTGSVSVSERLPDCIDTVDVTAVAKRGLSHSTWAESPRVLDDLRFVLRDGLEPLARGLTRRRMLERTVWMLPVVAPPEMRNVARPPSFPVPICRRH